MPTETSTQAPLRVLYDGGCPLCRREIAHYQRLSPRRAIHWIDIDADRDQPLPLGLSREQVMARFHVLNGEDIQTGAHAFLLLWSALPGWRHLGRMVRLLHLAGWLEQGYIRFARRRLRQRCRDGACSVG